MGDSKPQRFYFEAAALNPLIQYKAGSSQQKLWVLEIFTANHKLDKTEDAPNLVNRVKYPY